MKNKHFIPKHLSITGIVIGMSITVFFMPRLQVSKAANVNKTHSQSFKVSSQNPNLTLSNPSGSVKITAWEKAEIKIFANLDENLEVTEHQKGSSINVDVKCSKIGKASFEVNVPTASTLDIKSLNGMIEILSVSGPISVQTTEGEITLKNITSNNVTAKSTSGAVIFSGKLLEKGIYNFSSSENNVNVSLLPDSAFTLSITAFSEKIDLGGFHLTDLVKHERRLSGKHSDGSASLNLTTHKGKIVLSKHLHK
jgi:ribosomal protein L11